MSATIIYWPCANGATIDMIGITGPKHEVAVRDVAILWASLLVVAISALAFASASIYQSTIRITELQDQLSTEREAKRLCSQALTTATAKLARDSELLGIARAVQTKGIGGQSTGATP